MSDDAKPSFFIDADWIARVMEKRAQLVAQRDYADQQINDIDKKLTEIKELGVSVSKLIGEHIPVVKTEDAEVKKPKEAKARKPKKLPRFVKVGGKLVTFASEIKKVVDPAERGVHYDDIKEAVLNGPLGDKMRANSKAFYTAIARLTHEGYVKYKNHLFTQAHYDEFLVKVLVGDEEDLKAEDANRKPSVVAAVLAVVNDSPKGLAPKDVIAALTEKQELADSSKNNVYNALARLSERGEIARTDGLYYPTNKNGSPEKASQATEEKTLF
ncbi:MAG: hypothetical protein ACTHLA_10720 [Asticcacaulis sp.]|uniref:hypothetical protein n=1 Tax=Asticcacaulis sp. TaxID=1872648 RepID=UPI003F7C228A